MLPLEQIQAVDTRARRETTDPADDAQMSALSQAAHEAAVRYTKATKAAAREEELHVQLLELRQKEAEERAEWRRRAASQALGAVRPRGATFQRARRRTMDWGASALGTIRASTTRRDTSERNTAGDLGEASPLASPRGRERTSTLGFLRSMMGLQDSCGDSTAQRSHSSLGESRRSNEEDGAPACWGSAPRESAGCSSARDDSPGRTHRVKESSSSSAATGYLSRVSIETETLSTRERDESAALELETLRDTRGATFVSTRTDRADTPDWLIGAGVELTRTAGDSSSSAEPQFTGVVPEPTPPPPVQPPPADAPAAAAPAAPSPTQSLAAAPASPRAEARAARRRRAQPPA
jgi:hypothetical protein